VQYPDPLHLSPLQQSDLSLEKIRSNFGKSKMLISAQATRDRFLKLFQQYQISQLYTHAAEFSNKDEPVIFFCQLGLVFI